MQKEHIEKYNLGWNTKKAQKSAQEMFDRIFKMKFLPPGRGLWAMGSAITEQKKLYAALNNCGFCTTANLKEDLAKPFCFLMDASMLGVGVGFDVKGAGTIMVRGANKDHNLTYQIPDTREGWVESVRLLIESYFHGSATVNFDYSLIRAAGEPIRGFGGTSSGYEPLKEAHERIRTTLDKNINSEISITSIVDIMNMIGACVVAGNVRRTAEIVFGDPNSDEYLKLKDYRWDDKKNEYVGSQKQRADYGWTSNNSIFADLGMDYDTVATQTAKNGEPGYAWLENMQKFSRMDGAPDNKDHRVSGGNPCLEQSLESYELCCLVETFPNNHATFEDFQITLKYAYLYAKTVTLGQTHWAETNRVLLRNRRIGCSMSGITQFIANKGINELKTWCERGYQVLEKYDEIYSDWLAIPKSIKKTSIKPSGTVSLLAGATPGVHFPEDIYYIRRIRLGIHSDLIDPLKAAGYKIEPCVGSENSTVVVEVPVFVGNLRTVRDVSMWEQLSIAAFMQKYWADNQVSCTVTFKPHEAEQIKYALDYYQYQLKGISFLPLADSKSYAQMPYEGISADDYEKMIQKIKPVKFKKIKHEEADVEKFCSNDTCVIRPKNDIVTM
jgi:ribonucleoside-triphosphate reductase